MTYTRLRKTIFRFDDQRVLGRAFPSINAAKRANRPLRARVSHNSTDALDHLGCSREQLEDALITAKGDLQW